MIYNYDQCLRFSIDDKKISLVEELAVEVVADNRNNICCKFECDEQWDGVAKVARFIYNGQWKDVVLDVDCMCYVPSEVIKEGRFSVGLYGDNLKASTPLVVTVLASILSENDGELPDAPTNDVYTQILTLTSEANAKADAATEAAWAAVNASTEAIKALNKAKEEMEEAGFVNTLKEKHKGVKLGFWIGTQAEYDALENKPTDCYVIIEDDATLDDILDMLDAHRTSLGSHQSQIAGLRTQLNNLIKVGSYVGNGESSQFIDLGYTPSVLFVFRPGKISYKNLSYGGEWHNYAIAMPGVPWASGLEVIENGFNARYSVTSTTSDNDYELNNDGATYYYLAFNLGGA